MDREKVIDALEKCAAAECDDWCPYSEIQYGCRPKLMLDAMAMLKEQEKNRAFYVDIFDDLYSLAKSQTEVVRCKDCKHCYYASNRVPDERSFVCEKHGIDITVNWYCADGEREEDSQG